MQHKQIIYIMCGPAGSGKSTVAREIIEHASNLSQTTGYICPDCIREAVLGDAASQERGDYIWSLAYKQLEQCWGLDIIVFDATNLTKFTRKKLLEKIHQCEDKFNSQAYTIVVVFNTPLDDCLKRQSMRARKVPENIIRNQFKKFSHPTIQEGWTVVKEI